MFPGQWKEALREGDADMLRVYLTKVHILAAYCSPR